MPTAKDTAPSNIGIDTWSSSKWAPVTRPTTDTISSPNPTKRKIHPLREASVQQFRGVFFGFERASASLSALISLFASIALISTAARLLSANI